MYIVDTWIVFHTRISSMAGSRTLKINFSFKNFVAIVSWLICLVGIQAKMGMTEDFESSLQVLRGFDTDISIEVNEIKVLN